MTDWFPFCPEPPRWQLDWEVLNDAFPCIRGLKGCPQDPSHHGEGDVWVHTRLVCEALAAMPAFQESTGEERAVLFAAALLHDVGKSTCTRRDADGRLTARGHSRRGAIETRTVLWQMNVPIAMREQIAGLIRYHQLPFFLIDQPDSRRRVIEASQTARCDLLALLAEADARGRVCADVQRMLENAWLFAEYCREQGCSDRPYQFSSDHARFLYFHGTGRDPDFPAYDDTRCDAILLSGLPGSGKDHWVRKHGAGLPVISLDVIRAELRVDPTDRQGPVVDRARQMARSFLREHQTFVWNATNLSRGVRHHCIELFAAYRARVRIVYVEVSPRHLLQQNQLRSSQVPQSVIERLLRRWEVPDRTEAHQVDWIAERSQSP